MLICQVPVCLSALRYILLRLPTVLMVPSLPLASVLVWLTPVQQASSQQCSQQERETFNKSQTGATLHWDWRATCRVGQCKSNGWSCDVYSDVMKRFVQHEGESLFLPRVSCLLKDGHLRQNGERGGWMISFPHAGSTTEGLLHALAYTGWTSWTAESYQSWSRGVEDDICGLRQLSLGHLDGLASRGQSQVLVVFKGSSSDGTASPPPGLSKKE